MTTYNDVARQINKGFFEKLSDEGIATIKTDIVNREEIIKGLLMLEDKLGKIIPHTTAQSFADITLKSRFNDRSVIRPQSDNGPQAPHVDGVLSEVTPSFMVMHCISPAAVGGESVYVDTKDILEFILQKDYATFAPLFHPKAVAVARPQFGKKHKPVFKIRGDVLETYFSNHEYNKVDSSIEAETAFDLISTFIKSPENQKIRQTHPGDLVFVVNRRLLHGRKAFSDSSSQRRHYVRAWYDGSKANIPPCSKGLCINEKQFSILSNLSVFDGPNPFLS